MLSFYKPFFRFLLLSLLASCGNTPRASPESEVEANPAYANLNDSISRFPKDATLFLRRATRLSLASAHELAYHDFKKAWLLQPSAEIALPYAANLEILGNHSERLALLKSASEKIPSNQQLRRLLADAYAISGNQALALKQYQEMLEKDSLDFETWYEQALLMEQLKDTAGAIQALKTAYGIQGVATYGLELAHLYAEQKDPKALAICDDILKKDSAGLFIDPLMIKGIYYANIKQYPLAIAQFDACIKRDWKTTDAYLEKGIIYYHQQNYREAINTFNMAITVSNTDPDAYYWLGRCYEATHRKTEAISQYQKSFSLDKNFKEAKEAAERLQSGFGGTSH
jgi:tetratricopeptide (TPR) repeat protein